MSSYYFNCDIILSVSLAHIYWYVQNISESSCYSKYSKQDLLSGTYVSRYVLTDYKKAMPYTLILYCTILIHIVYRIPRTLFNISPTPYYYTYYSRRQASGTVNWRGTTLTTPDNMVARCVTLDHNSVAQFQTHPLDQLSGFPTSLKVPLRGVPLGWHVPLIFNTYSDQQNLSMKFCILIWSHSRARSACHGASTGT